MVSSNPQESVLDPSSINCPHCHRSFALTEAIAQPIVEKLRAQFESDSAEQLKTARAAEREKVIAEQEKKAKEAVGIELADLQEQLREKDEKLEQSQKSQLELLKQRRELDEQKKLFELQKTEQIEAEREKIRAEVQQSAAEAATDQMRELNEKLDIKEKLLTEARQAELTLRKERTEFEEQKKGFANEVARQTDEAKELAKKEKDEEFRLKEAEKNKQLDDMKRQIDELKRKAEQGSQQTQGEVLELDLETDLCRVFVDDEIAPVAKGVHGGDVLQHVRTQLRQACGCIIWESKRTKSWSDGWLAKLKDDQLAAKAQIAVIVSTAMPREVPAFECRENVWITPPKYAMPLAAALRHALMETAAAKRVIDGQQGKMEVVYAYLASGEFKGRVEAIVDSFKTMQDDLEAEKRAIQRAWAKRAKQLERVLSNTAGMYGDLSGIIGHSLPAIDRLEFPALAEPDDDTGLARD